MKNQYIAAFLAFFLGSFGLHRIYLGNIITGLIYLLFMWTGIPLILGIIESFYFILLSKNTFNFKYNRWRMY